MSVNWHRCYNTYRQLRDNTNIMEISERIKEFNNIFDKIDKNKKINVKLYTEDNGSIIIDKSKIVSIIRKIQTQMEEINKFFNEINLDCFYKNKNDIENLKKCNTYKPSIKTAYTDLLYKYSLFNFTKIFNDHKIEHYIILDNDNYEIYRNNYDEVELDNNYYFKLTTELSLELIPKPEIIKYNSNLLQNTRNTKYDDFVSAKIINNNDAFKEILIKNINENNTDESFKKLFEFIKKLYGYDRQTKQFLIDIYNKYDNIFLIILFINKPTIIYDFLNKRITNDECKESYKDLINSNPEYYANVFNYYKNVNNLRLNLNDKILKDINENLKINVNTIKEEFIKKIYDFIDEIDSIESELPNIMIYLLSDYILDITSLSDFDIYPFSKRKLFETLFEMDAYEISNTNSIVIDDVYFNYESHLPYLYSKKNVHYKGHTFPDCGEATLFNLITYLLTDKNSNNFILEKLPVNSNIKKFFEKFKNYTNLKNQFKKILNILKMNGRQSYTNIKILCMNTNIVK